MSFFDLLDAKMNIEAAEPITHQRITGLGSAGKRASVDEHPWIDDIRAMTQVMEGSIPIPHPIIELQGVFTSGCAECYRAFKLKLQYQREIQDASNSI